MIVALPKTINGPPSTPTSDSLLGTKFPVPAAKKIFFEINVASDPVSTKA